MMIDRAPGSLVYVRMNDERANFRTRGGAFRNPEVGLRTRKKIVHF